MLATVEIMVWFGLSFFKSHQNGKGDLQGKENLAWWGVLQSGLGLQPSLCIQARNRSHGMFGLNILLRAPLQVFACTNCGGSRQESTFRIIECAQTSEVVQPLPETGVLWLFGCAR